MQQNQNTQTRAEEHFGPFDVFFKIPQPLNTLGKDWDGKRFIFSEKENKATFHLPETKCRTTPHSIEIEIDEGVNASFSSDAVYRVKKGGKTIW